MMPNKVMAMNDPIKTAVIFGTRPEAIKLAPLIRRMADAPARIAAQAGQVGPADVGNFTARQLADRVVSALHLERDPEFNPALAAPYM